MDRKYWTSPYKDSELPNFKTSVPVSWELRIELLKFDSSESLYREFQNFRSVTGFSWNCRLICFFPCTPQMDLGRLRFKLSNSPVALFDGYGLFLRQFQLSQFHMDQIPMKRC